MCQAYLFSICGDYLFEEATVRRMITLLNTVELSVAEAYAQSKKIARSPLQTQAHANSLSRTQSPCHAG